MDYQDLTQLGLTPGESKVYLALLKLGQTKVGKIVKESDVAYSNIYDVLDRLKSKGLVSWIIKGKTRYFQASDHYKFEDYLEEKQLELNNQKEKLKKIIPNLEAISKKKDSNLNAEIFTGWKGLKTAFLKMIKQENITEYLFSYIDNSQYNLVDADYFFISLLDELKKRNIPIKGIADKSYKKSQFLSEVKHDMQIRFADFPTVGNIDICKDKVLITSWSKTPIGLLIHSQEIANNLTNYFNFVWQSSKNINKK